MIRIIDNFFADIFFIVFNLLIIVKIISRDSSIEIASSILEYRTKEIEKINEDFFKGEQEKDIKSFMDENSKKLIKETIIRTAKDLSYRILWRRSDADLITDVLLKKLLWKISWTYKKNGIDF